MSGLTGAPFRRCPESGALPAPFRSFPESGAVPAPSHWGPEGQMSPAGVTAHRNSAGGVPYICPSGHRLRQSPRIRPHSGHHTGRFPTGAAWKTASFPAFPHPRVHPVRKSLRSTRRGGDIHSDQSARSLPASRIPPAGHSCLRLRIRPDVWTKPACGCRAAPPHTGDCPGPGICSRFRGSTGCLSPDYFFRMP